MRYRKLGIQLIADNILFVISIKDCDIVVLVYVYMWLLHNWKVLMLYVLLHHKKPHSIWTTLFPLWKIFFYFTIIVSGMIPLAVKFKVLIWQILLYQGKMKVLYRFSIFIVCFFYSLFFNFISFDIWLLSNFIYYSFFECIYLLLPYEPVHLLKFCLFLAI